MLELDGVDYFDDRMFLCWIGRCFLGPDEDGISFSTIFHEEPQRSALQDELDLWVVVFCRNTHRWPIVSLQHCKTRAMAEQYIKMVEPETPLVSLVGEKMDPVLTSEQWQALKRRKSWDDYDYRKVFSAEGTNPTEKVGWPSESVKILKLE